MSVTHQEDDVKNIKNIFQEIDATAVRIARLLSCHRSSTVAQDNGIKAGHGCGAVDKRKTFIGLCMRSM